MVAVEKTNVDVEIVKLCPEVIWKRSSLNENVQDTFREKWVKVILTDWGQDGIS